MPRKDVGKYCAPMAGREMKTTADGFEVYSTLTCPECGHKAKELMPTDACQFYFDCKGCRALLKPLKGDCCVYCSYGDVKCPPIQAGDQCC